MVGFGSSHKSPGFSPVHCPIPSALAHEDVPNTKTHYCPCPWKTVVVLLFIAGFKWSTYL